MISRRVYRVFGRRSMRAATVGGAMAVVVVRGALWAVNASTAIKATGALEVGAAAADFPIAVAGRLRAFRPADLARLLFAGRLRRRGRCRLDGLWRFLSHARQYGAGPASAQARCRAGFPTFLRNDSCDAPFEGATFVPPAQYRRAMAEP
jgi:hypothetical protein